MITKNHQPHNKERSIFETELKEFNLNGLKTSLEWIILVIEKIYFEIWLPHILSYIPC
jgi:hypothetical protein